LGSAQTGITLGAIWHYVIYRRAPLHRDRRISDPGRHEKLGNAIFRRALMARRKKL